MLFYSFFKTLIGKQVTVHLKNDVELTGTLTSVDPFLNLKLDSVHPQADSHGQYPHLLALRSAFIRGSVVRFVEVPAEAVEVGLLQDASRVEYANPVVAGKSVATGGGEHDDRGSDREDGLEEGEAVGEK